MGKTSIEWTDFTWNPTRGCSRVSPGCVNCYAERTAARFRGPAQKFEQFVKIVNGHPAWSGDVELIESKLTEPLHWGKKVRRCFVNSMSDLFHEALPDEAIDRVFAVMALCPQHTFQVLTKRAERMQTWAQRDWWKQGPYRNVWLGVSVEDQQRADERIPELLQTPAAVRFVSYEPALAEVRLKWAWVSKGHPFGGGPMCNLAEPWKEPEEIPGIDWVIVGGESGPGARPFDIGWARNTIAQCKAAGVACFVKQLGSRITGLNLDGPPYSSPPRREGFLVHWTSKDSNTFGLCDPKGGEPEHWPEDLRVREFPA